MLECHPSCKDALHSRDTLWYKIVYHADRFTKYLMAPPDIKQQDLDYRSRPLPFHDTGAQAGELEVPPDDATKVRQYYALRHLHGLELGGDTVLSMNVIRGTSRKLQALAAALC